jgi:hypothetical protein
MSLQAHRLRIGVTCPLETELTALRAEALFASDVQRSDNPTAVQIRAAVSASLRRHGERECAASVAQQFGEHPVEAVWRMSWVLQALRSAYTDAGLVRPGLGLHAVRLNESASSPV